MDNQNTDHIDAIASLARKALGDKVETIKLAREGDIPVLLLDEGRKYVDVAPLIKAFEKTQNSPFRRRGTYRAADVDSFVRWADANTEDEVPVFAEGAEKLSDWKQPKLALVILGNYSKRDAAGWHDFGARYDFAVSEQWKVWTGNHEKSMSQGDFAEFIEDRLYDLSSPQSKETLSEAVTRFIEHTGGDKGASPGKIVELSRGLKVTANAQLDTQVNIATGEATLNYHEEHQGTGGRPIKVPKLFYIRVPVFFGLEPVLVGVRLRYRVNGGAVSWFYSLFAPEVVISTEFEAACEQVRKAGREVYLGAPDKPD